MNDLRINSWLFANAFANLPMYFDSERDDPRLSLNKVTRNIGFQIASGFWDRVGLVVGRHWAL
jgi:hypothetical protein